MRPATCVGVLPCNPVSGLQDRPLGVEGPAHRKARSDVTSGLLRSMGRAYTLLTHRHPYDGNPANPYIKELQFILSVVRNKWHQYNMTMRVAGEQPSNAERQKWGLSHQLLFDFECMIEGFIGLLADLESRYKKVAVLARKINQVPVNLGSHMSPPAPVSPSVSATPLIMPTTPEYLCTGFARDTFRLASVLGGRGGVHSHTTKSRLVSVVCKSSGRCRKRCDGAQETVAEHRRP